MHDVICHACSPHKHVCHSMQGATHGSRAIQQDADGLKAICSEAEDTQVWMALSAPIGMCTSCCDGIPNTYRWCSREAGATSWHALSWPPLVSLSSPFGTRLCPFMGMAQADLVLHVVKGLPSTTRILIRAIAYLRPAQCICFVDNCKS